MSGAADRQIVLSRLLPVCRDRVFELWTRPDHLARWWGPPGSSLDTDAFDARPGGRWQFTVRGRDGTVRRDEVVYDQVRSPERLVYSHRAPAFRTTVTFDEMAGMTALTMRLVFATREERDAVEREYHARDGAAGTLDRLGEAAGLAS